MQTCPECGERNEDGELFCGSCGTYLEWQEPRAPAAASSGEVAGADVGAAGETSAAVGETPVVEPVAVATALAGPVPSAEPAADRAERAGDADRPVAAPVEADPTAPTRARVGGGTGIGALGGRASRMLRQTADQATGGAVSKASSTASRAASTGRAPRQAAGAGIRRAVSKAGPAAGGAGTPAARTAAQVASSSSATTTRSSPQAPRETADGPPTATTPPATGRAQPTPGPYRAAPVPGQPAPGQPAPAKPAARQPAARRPGAPAPRRPVPAAQEEEPPPNPGDLICGACGAGNTPHRNFCRRCGASLADAPVQAQRSWWRRLRRPDRKPPPAAGTRPRSRRRRRFPTGLVVTLVVLGALAGAAWYFRDTISTTYDAVLDRVAGDDPVNPTGVTASSELADRPAGQARDGISDRSWAPEGEGPGEWIEFEFAEPYRLVTLLVSAGNGPDEEQRLLEARPAAFRLTLTTTSGERIEDVELTDSGEPQEVPVAVSGVEAVRLTILSVYGEQLQAPVAFAEVEFRGRG